jgi:alpha-beta hydrolase superfamily lysophospholipase
MKPFFAFSYFNAQLLRTLSYIPTGGADLGECLACAEKIVDGDFNSWYNEWIKLADRTYQTAMKSRSNHSLISARDAFFRASNYYRTAGFFLYKLPTDFKLIHSLDLNRDSFSKAIEYLAPTPEPIHISIGKITLPGFFYKAADDGAPRPTIIANSGYDSCHQELYFSIVKPALERGYNVLAFDGPGQGELLIKKNIPMRHDWETVVTPIVDYLLTRNDVVPNQIALIGLSWGGNLAPRAAAYEHRLAALIADPGQFEPLQRIKAVVPQMANFIEQKNTTAIEKIFLQIAQDRNLAFTFQAKQYVHQLPSLTDLVQEWTKYNLAEAARLIRCPTLILDGENETYSKGQAKQLYDALRCPKDYHLFTAAEGAGEHCQTGALTAFWTVAFDWLQDHLPVPSRDRIAR